MMDSNYWKGPRLWIQGVILLSLRLAQLKNGFDPETGLSRASVPGTVLAIVIVLMIAVEAVLCFRLPRGKRSYANCLEPFSGNAVPMLAAGSFLLGPGFLLSMKWSAFSLVTAAFGFAATVGLLVFVQRVRKAGEAPVLALLPATAYAVLFLLTVYIPEESNPVLARYYLPVLAACLIACTFYQLAGFSCREGSLGLFVFFGDLAVPLSLASMAGCAGKTGRMLVYFGFALVLTQFLMARRVTPLPEPEPESKPENTEGQEPARE